MTVTQLVQQQMAADTPSKDPSQTLSLPARRAHHTKSTTDISEEDLGIFEDEADCDDLTDSDEDGLDTKNEGQVSKDTHSETHIGLATAHDSAHQWEGSQDDLTSVETPRSQGQVKIEVSISRRSKTETKPTLTELSLTLTPRSDRSDESYQGFRAKTNTPVGSLASDRSEYGSYERQSQGGGSASREAMFQQALTLMSQRCVSVVHNSIASPLPESKRPHYGRSPATLSSSTPLNYPLLNPSLLGPTPTTQTAQKALSTPRARRAATVLRGSKSVPTTRRHNAASVAAAASSSPSLRDPATTTAAPGRHQEHRIIFVKQTRPSPMPPLKAWRGFSGNVYFEPIKVKSVAQPPSGITVANPHTSPDPSTTTTVAVANGVKGHQNGKGKLTGVTSSSEGGMASDVSTDGQVEVGHAEYGHPHGFPVGGSFKPQFKIHKSGQNTQHSKGKQGEPRKKMVIVDKGNVYANNFDSLMNSMSDDIEWVVGQHQNKNTTSSTGSLRHVPAEMRRPPGYTSPRKEGAGSGNGKGKFQYNREKICRGSVAHRDFYSPNREAEIASAFTTKSMASNQRLSPLRTDNKSPDKENSLNSNNKTNGEAGANAKLPPLDSKTKANGKTDDPLSTLALEQNMKSNGHPHPKDKPFVKYSRTTPAKQQPN